MCTTLCTHNAVKRAFKPSKYLKRERNKTQYSSKSTNYCDLRVSGLLAKMENACTTFCTHNAVISVFKRRNTSNGREITLNYRPYSQIIVNYVCLGLFRRWKTSALRSARIMQRKERFSVEISQMGEK